MMCLKSSTPSAHKHFWQN